GGRRQPWNASDPLARAPGEGRREARVPGSRTGGGAVAGGGRSPPQRRPAGHATLRLPSSELHRPRRDDVHPPGPKTQA
ncbi:unnamed protein product, partial [Ectocarpus sp. 12 AP-2014]